jgi:hypothetical protein
VTLYRFSSRTSARSAVKKTKQHVRTCPGYTEWVCTHCDGICDVWQHLAPISNVGDRTVAWAGRLHGNVGERFRAAVVLDRRYAIKVQVSVGKDAGGLRFPAVRPTKGELRRLARYAYLSLP